MTPDVALALLAGLPAAAGLADLGAAWSDRRRWPARGGRLRALLVDLGRRVGAPAPPADLHARLDAAGAPLSVADAMAVKAGAALLGALVTLPLVLGLPGRLALLTPVGAAAAGFLVPDAWLWRRARRRAEAITIELPAALDLLRVALRAGMPTLRALGEVGHRLGGRLGTELRDVAAQTTVGVPRAAALQRLRRRAPTEEVAQLVMVLDRAERLGTPPADALAALSRDAREARARVRTEAAARAAPKIQLVVALLLVPAVMLLVAAALAPRLLQGF